MFKPVHPFIARAKDQLIKFQLWATPRSDCTSVSGAATCANRAWKEDASQTANTSTVTPLSLQSRASQWLAGGAFPRRRHTLTADRLEPRSLRTSGRRWRTAPRSVSASRFFFYKCTSWRKALKAATGDLGRLSGGSSVASANANAKRRTSSYWVTVHFVFCRARMLLNIQLVSDTCITEVLRQRPRSVQKRFVSATPAAAGERGPLAAALSATCERNTTKLF